MMGTETTEQRLWSRFEVDMPVQVITDLGESFSAQCLDWSSHGLKLCTQQPMALTQTAQIQVQATQPGIVDLEATIEVQRCEKKAEDWIIGAHVLDIR